MADHPVDTRGRSLPACDWPADRAAPGGLETVRRLCNTANLESGADLLVTPDALDEWLTAQGRARVDADTAELARVVRFREILRGHAIAHRLWVIGHDMGDLASVIAHVDLRVVHRNGRLVVEPGVAPSVDQFLAAIGLAVIEADRLATWPRVKACQNCSWVFYDSSKNASGRWCSMSACGGRAKVRNHRRRQRSA